jgi:hypothetical protein
VLELTLESSYGREFGWFVDRNGQRLAALLTPRREDMFWVSYVIEPLGQTPEDRALVLQNSFWEPPGPTFSNRLSGLVGNRVVMRGLCARMAPTQLEYPLL